MSLCVKTLRANGLSLFVNGKSTVWSISRPIMQCFEIGTGDASYAPCVWSEKQIWSPPNITIISGLVLAFNETTKSFVFYLNGGFVKDNSDMDVTWMKIKQRARVLKVQRLGGSSRNK